MGPFTTNGEAAQRGAFFSFSFFYFFYFYLLLLSTFLLAAGQWAARRNAPSLHLMKCQCGATKVLDGTVPALPWRESIVDWMTKHVLRVPTPSSPIAGEEEPWGETLFSETAVCSTFFWSAGFFPILLPFPVARAQELALFFFPGTRQQFEVWPLGKIVSGSGQGFHFVFLPHAVMLRSPS